MQYIPDSIHISKFSCRNKNTTPLMYICVKWSGRAQKKWKHGFLKPLPSRTSFLLLRFYYSAKKFKSGQNLFRLCSSRGFRSKNILTGQNSKTHRDASPQFTSKARVVTFPRFSSVKTVPKLTYAVRHSMSAWLKARPEEWSRGQSEYPQGMTRALMIFLDSW